MKRAYTLSIFCTFVVLISVLGNVSKATAQENEIKNRQLRTKKALENVLWVAGIQSKQNEKAVLPSNSKKMIVEFPEELTRPLTKLSLKL